MITKVGIILFLVFTPLLLSAQSLKGKVIDSESKEGIPFAKISVNDLSINTMTNEEGDFNLSNLPRASVEIIVYARDYEKKLIRINISQESEILIRLKSEHTVFEEVIISTSEGRLQKENITAVEYRSKDNLFESGATTLGEAIVNIPGVQQSTIGVGISRPVIRGLSGARVVTYWDGLRIENQQWGDDHGMAASEIGLKGVEVVKGPSSLLYGADALGGVIHFRDEDYVPVGTQSFYASSRVESNSMGSINELGYQKNNGKVKVNLFGNYVSHADFQLPDGNFIENSRFWSTNIKGALGYRKDNYILNVRYHGSYSKLGIPGHTHDTNPDADKFISTRRGLRTPLFPAQYIFNNFLTTDHKFLFDHSDLMIQIGNTNNYLREFEHNDDVPFTNLMLNNSTYNIRYNYHFNEKLNLKVGGQGMFQLNRNLAPTESYLIPNANSIDNGAYAVVNYDLNKWRFQGGIRYDVRHLKSFTPDVDTTVTTNIDETPLDRVYNTLNYSAGFVRNSKRTTLRFNASSGFRAPHLGELLADGVHHGSLRYERGDRDLVSEQALQLDLALELHFDHFEFIINPYFSAVNNFIYLQSTDSMVVSQVGEFNYFEFNQVDRAFLYGGEIGFHYHPHKLHRLHLESNFSITIGEDENGNALNLIPQPNLNSRIRFDINNKHKLKVKYITLEHQYFMDQDRVATFERATPAFHLLNFAAHFKYQGKQKWNFSLGARNILNTEYIAHLSPLKNLGTGIAQPGINFFVKATYLLNKSTKVK